MAVKIRERETDRQTGREKERDRERQRQRETETETQRETETETEWDRDRDRERQRETERGRDRDRDRETETERQRQRDRERYREKERERERERDRERQRETDRQRQRETERHRDREREDLCFRYRLSRARMVKNYFDRMKGRLDCIKRFMDININNLPHFIVLIFILHNFCEDWHEILKDQNIKAAINLERQFPVNTRHCFNIYKTSVWRRFINIEAASCVYWVSVSSIY